MARPILAEQRRLARIGTIRAGEKGAKGQPAKLETWRLTSSSLPVLRAAADLYGGSPREWSDESSDERYELYTSADAIPVAWAPGVCSWSSKYEAWSRAGRTRICDGVTVSVVDPETGEVDQRPCMCDGSGTDDCKPTTRVSFILPELPGLGVWLLTTRSDYAAREMPGALDILEQLIQSRRPVRATLRLVQRTTRKPGERYPRRYAVPVIDLDVSVGQLMSGQAPVEHPALPAGGEDGEAPDTSPSREAPAATVEPPAPPEKGPTIKQVEYLWIIAGEKYGQKRKEQVVRTIMADLAPGVESTKDLTRTQYEAVLDAVAAGQDPHADALFGDAA